jgi:hypothetical protein
MIASGTLMEYIDDLLKLTLRPVEVAKSSKITLR